MNLPHHLQTSIDILKHIMDLSIEKRSKTEILSPAKRL